MSIEWNSIVEKGVIRGMANRGISSPNPETVKAIANAVVQHIEIAADLFASAALPGLRAAPGVNSKASSASPARTQPAEEALIESLHREEKILGDGAMDALRELRGGSTRNQILGQRAIEDPDSAALQFDPSRRIGSDQEVRIKKASIEEIEDWAKEKLPSEVELMTKLSGVEVPCKFYRKITRRKKAGEPYGEVQISYIPGFAAQGPCEVIFEADPKMDVLEMMESFRQQAKSMYSTPTRQIQPPAMSDRPYSPERSMSGSGDVD